VILEDGSPVAAPTWPRATLPPSPYLENAFVDAYTSGPEMAFLPEPPQRAADDAYANPSGKV